MMNDSTKHLQECITAEAGHLLHHIFKNWAVYLLNLISESFVTYAKKQFILKC
jgi:hypothetical protein